MRSGSVEIEKKGSRGDEKMLIDLTKTQVKEAEKPILGDERIAFAW